MISFNTKAYEKLDQVLRDLLNADELVRYIIPEVGYLDAHQKAIEQLRALREDLHVIVSTGTIFDPIE